MAASIGKKVEEDNGKNDVFGIRKVGNWTNQIVENLKDQGSHLLGGNRKSNPDGTSEERRIAFMGKLISDYLNLLNSSTNEDFEFWDLVVLSAGNESQKYWYEMQLSKKKLPPGVEFRVYSDPGGIRTGDGGATLNIVDLLYQEYWEEKIDKMRILMIHAGGYSKRLPSHSCTSKIFSILPIKPKQPESTAENDLVFDMLDANLFLYLPFLSIMGPGMFATACDDLEGYFISSEELEEVKESFGKHDPTVPALYSLGHPSSLAIGTGHGVFKFSQEEKERIQKPGASAVLIEECIEVLQKPSVEKMRAKGMVVNDPTTGQELVYTDSAYWMNPALLKKLRAFNKDNQPIQVETSMYSDFMICQGISTNKDSVQSLKNNAREETEELKFKLKVCDLMESISLKILLLPQSTFYHIGTLQEYLEVFCGDSQLAREFSFNRSIAVKRVGTVNESHRKQEGVLINSVIPSSLCLPKTTVIENSRIESCQIEVLPGTIISNCIIGSHVKGLVPGNTVYHTVPIKGGKFVTIAFSLFDNIKKAVKNFEDLPFSGRQVLDLFQGQEKLTRSNLFPKDCDGNSLWHCQLFPEADSAEESFEMTLNVLLGNATLGEDIKTRHGMEQLVQIMDMEGMLKMREDLTKRINAGDI